MICSCSRILWRTWLRDVIFNSALDWPAAQAKPLIPHHIPQQIKLIEGHSNWSNDWGPLLGKMGKKVHLADLAAYQWCGCSFEMTHVFLTLVWSRDAMGQFPVPWVTSFRHCFYITALAVSIIGGTYTIYKAYVREYPHKIWPYMVQYLHFRILKLPLAICLEPELYTR